MPIFKDVSPEDEQLIEEVTDVFKQLIDDAAAKGGGDPKRIGALLNPNGEVCSLVGEFLGRAIAADEEGDVMLDEAQQAGMTILASFALTGEVKDPKVRAKLAQMIPSIPFIHHLSHVMFELGVAYSLLKELKLPSDAEYADMRDFSKFSLDQLFGKEKGEDDPKTEEGDDNPE